VLRALEKQTGQSAEQLLEAAKNMGVFRGDIQQTLIQLRQYTEDTEAATRATDAFSRALKQQSSDLLKAGDQADEVAKKRKALISAATSLARESSDTFEGALKSLRAFIAAQPELRAAVERERQLEGKSIEGFLEDALSSAFKRRRDKSGTSLRNAQEQLAKSLAEVALASTEQQVALEKNKNERLLQINETAQRLQIISYREFLETKAALSAASIDREISQQEDVVRAAKTAQLRLIAAAGKPEISAAERTKRQAQAADANEAAIKAETKLAELQSKREAITETLQQSLKEFQFQQLKDVRQLEIEYAQLTGRIEDSLNAATDEKFRESLQDLALAQDRLNKQIIAETKAKNADRVAELELARAQNQRQIEAIQNIVTQERATNRLAAAQELVRRAQDKQSELEKDLAFQVEFRGLSEERAITQRLAGEQKLAASLRLSRDLVQSMIDALNLRGVKPPEALLEFVRELNTSIQGLGELSFSEQFRLAQKEFDRINEERVAKIQDVERAVRNRDIAEVEGAIIIRRINNQYTADLEAQLTVLKQIAAASNDRNLQRQALDAGEVVKDTKDQVASLSKQIDSAGKDAFRSGLTQFFIDLRDNSQSALEDFKKFLDGIVQSIENVIAENLSKKLFESLFGGAEDQAGGLIARVKRFFGGGGGTEAAVHAGEATAHVADVTTAAHTADATAASAALQTGAAAASATLEAGITASSATFTTSVVTAATSFASLILSAGAAFAASVAAGGAAQAAGRIGSSFAGAAATGMFPAVPGGVVRIVEGGFPEAVLTTDPKHAVRQVAILKAFLRETRGLGGRIRGLAQGGFALPSLTPSVVGMPSLNANLGNVEVGSQALNLRILNLLDKRQLVGGHLRSAEGARDIMNIISENSDEIGRRMGIR